MATRFTGTIYKEMDIGKFHGKMDKKLEQNYVVWLGTLDLNGLYTEKYNLDFLTENSRKSNVLEIVRDKKKLIEKEYERRKISKYE